MTKVKKSFIYSIKELDRKGNMRCSVYQIKRNRPIYVGWMDFKSGCSKGGDAEVLKFLIEQKQLPKYLYNVSQCSWRGVGYYCPEIEDKGYFIKCIC